MTPGELRQRLRAILREHGKVGVDRPRPAAGGRVRFEWLDPIGRRGVLGLVPKAEQYVAVTELLSELQEWKHGHAQGR